MCIFSGPVESVSKTKILVAPVSKDTQLTVYANQVQLSGSTPTAMILPFPNPTGRADGVAMIDMTEFRDNFFSLVEKAFPSTHIQKSVLHSRSVTLSLDNSRSLEVFDCGSYQYSVSPTLSDLERIRSDVFSLDPNVQQTLSTHYSMGFGFLVCILKKSGSYSPIAYTSPMIKGRIFIPTRHEHGPSHTDGYHPINGFYRSQVVRANDPNVADDWDHDIYILGGIDRAVPDRMGTSTQAYSDLSQILPASHVVTKLIGHITKDYFYKWRIQGSHRNCDLSVPSLFAISVDACSYSVTGKGYLVQPWFNCVTCKLINGLGCCVACAMTCHKGHVLIPQSLSSFFCDCRDKASCTFAATPNEQLPYVPSKEELNHISASLVGKSVAAAEDFAGRSARPDLWRFLPEGSIVTMDFVYGRMTAYYNRYSIVTSVTHG